MHTHEYIYLFFFRSVISLRMTTSSPKHVPLTKHPLSLLQLLLLNSIVCGLEFCASAAFTYIPPMLLKAGLSETHMTGVLGVGPLLGFLVVPIIGRASDKCRSRYGRRRPFILALSLLVVISLLIIPYGELLGVYALGENSHRFGVPLLIIGSVMLDFSSQACLTPCEALLSDACKGTGQLDTCFTVYSFMVSLGGCIGYLITALDWSSSSVGLYFGGQEQSAFSVLIVLFIMTTCASLGVVDEHYLPNDEEDDNDAITETLDRIHTDMIHTKCLPLHNDPGYESGSNHSLQVVPQTDDQRETQRRIDAPHRVTRHNGRPLCSISLSYFVNLKLFMSTILCSMWSTIYTWLPGPLKLLLSVPYVLRSLALANFCSWTAVMSFNLFFTDYVGQAVYGGDPNAPDDSKLRALYDEGVRSGSWGLLFHCVFSALSAACIERVVAAWGMRRTYMTGMLTFVAAMFILVTSRSIVVVLLMASCTGFAYATLTTIPFMLVSNYHDNKEVRQFYCT